MAVGGVVGVLVPGRVHKLFKRAFLLAFRQEVAMQAVLWVFAFMLAIFLSPLIFFLVALQGGKSLHDQAVESFVSTSIDPR